MKKRNNIVNLFKFIFCVCLVIFHGRNLLVNEEFFSIFKRSQIAVEFFFITSGYLMAISLNKQNNLYNFIKKKLSGIYPQFFLCWIISFIIINIFTFSSKKILLSNLLSSIWEILLLRNAGFYSYQVLPQTWYISSMIISMIFIFPIYKKFGKKFEKYIAPLISIFLLGYLYHFTGSLTDPNKYMIFMYKSTYRGLSEICLGIFCFYLCNELKKINFTKIGTLLLTSIELFGYLFSIFYMWKYIWFGKSFDYVILLFLACSVTISFSNKSYSKNLNSKIFNYLGKFSLYPYLISYCFLITLDVLYPTRFNNNIFYLYLLLTFVTSIILMNTQKYFNKFVIKLKNLLIVKNAD